MGIWFAPTVQQGCWETAAGDKFGARRGCDMSLAAGFSADDRQIGSRLEWENDKETCGIGAGSGQRQNDE
jgi:hypothetical protein